MTIEDETGIANCVIWPSLRETYRREVMGARLVLIEGRAQRSPEGIVHVVAERLTDRTFELSRLSGDRLEPPLANADEIRRPIPENRMSGGHSPRRHPRDVRVLPKSRDFH
jgi:error-prone DNA polymerase